MENFLYLCYDVNMWSIYGIDIRLLKEHPEYKEQIKLLPTRWEKVNKIKKEEDRTERNHLSLIVIQSQLLS